MTFRPLLMLLLILTALLVIYLWKRSSWEGRLIMLTALLAFGAYVRLHFYLLLLVALCLSTFIGVAFFWAWLASARLKVTREIKGEAMVGENIPVRYKVGSRGVVPLFHTRIWDMAFRQRNDRRRDEVEFEEPGYVGILKITAGADMEGLIHIKPPVRGLMELGPIAVQGGDPFGIFSLTRWLPLADELLVLPGWVLMNGLPSIPSRLGNRQQEHLISKEGHSHEFLGTRPYSEGDSLRGVHWPLTAKHDQLIVRQYQREVEEEMLVILDADRDADIGIGAENAFEYLVTLTLSLANAASDLGRPWILVVAGKEIRKITHQSKEPLLQAQHMLARLQADRDVPLETVIDDIRREFRNAACILLTARADSAPAEALSRIDAQLGGGISSVMIRVDPSGFSTSTGAGLESIKRRRKSVRTSTQPQHMAHANVTEFTISAGDNIADLFLSRMTA
jgi:uncharacterized protein (DUF58 family)